LKEIQSIKQFGSKRTRTKSEESDQTSGASVRKTDIESAIISLYGLWSETKDNCSLSKNL
jgi:hypothetical protein